MGYFRKKIKSSQTNIGLLDIKCHSILTPNCLPKKRQTCLTIKNIRQKSLLEETHSMLVIAQKTLFYSVPILWNNLVSTKQAMAPSIEGFKKYFS